MTAKKPERFSNEVVVSYVSDSGPKYTWIVLFKEYDPKPYTYVHRSVAHMEAIIADSYRRHGQFPFGVWAIINGEMEKAEVK